MRWWRVLFEYFISNIMLEFQWHTLKFSFYSFDKSFTSSCYICSNYYNFLINFSQSTRGFLVYTKQGKHLRPYMNPMNFFLLLLLLLFFFFFFKKSSFKLSCYYSFVQTKSAITLSNSSKPNTIEMILEIFFFFFLGKRFETEAFITIIKL
jgi:hypothetical protein